MTQTQWGGSKNHNQRGIGGTQIGKEMGRSSLSREESFNRQSNGSIPMIGKGHSPMKDRN